jgi:HflK protein
MSEPHDHSHKGHKHDHDHDHGHDHGHEHQQSAPAVPDPAPQREPSSGDDARTQALSAALESSFAIVKVAMVLLVIVFIGSGFFKVESHERAVVLHLGKPRGSGSEVLLGPGLHFALPYPIDEVRHIPYSQLMQVKSTVGWYRTTPEAEALDQEGNGSGSMNPASDGYVLTADQNIVHSRATLTYKIEDPVRYEFDFNNASNTVQNDLDNSLLYAAARFKVDDMLTRDMVRFQDVVRQHVTELVQQQNLGVVIEQLSVQTKPPLSLKNAFDGVLAAQSTRDKTYNEALSYQNEVVSKSEAESASRVNSAQADKVRLVESIRAEAHLFTDLLPGFKSNPSLNANRLLTEKIGQVLTNVQDKIYLPERADGKTRELRLQLSREPQGPSTKQPGNP